jgi:hypothetical protein
MEQSLVLRTNMYTQALNSGGGLAQRLNQHFYFEAIRVWDLSAMPFYQSGAGCFFADSGLPSDPPAEGEKLCVYSDFF